MARKFFTPINLTGLELTNFKIQNLGDNPDPYGAGHTYYNSSAKEVRVYDGSQWQPVGGSIEYGVYADIPAAGTAGRVFATTDTKVLYLDNGTVWLQIGIGTDTTDTLTNKTLDDAYVTGTLSFRDGDDNQYFSILQAYTGTTRLTAIDDIAIRSTEGDIILYPGNDDGGTGKAYVHWGNDATNANPQNEITTAGNTQTFTNKTIGDSGIYFNDQIDTQYGRIYNDGDNNLVIDGTHNDVIITSDSGYAYIGDNATPATRIATHSYVDGVVQGLNVKDSVLRMSDETIALESWNADGSFFDGVDTLQVGSRVLLTAQSTASENGIYVIQNDGSLARAADQPTVDKGDYTLVVEGTYAATGWIATSATAWTQFSAANEYTAGTGIDITANAISLDTANGYGVRKYSETIGDEETLNFTITHDFNTRDVTVTVYDMATYEEVFTGVEHSTVDTVTVKFAVAPDTDAFRVVVVG